MKSQAANPKLNRREFLKLASILPLLPLKLPYFVGEPTRLSDDPNATNVLVIVYDTLSAFHIPLYGYPRETMPNLARFAERANVYHNHYAGGNFTTPGTASLLTGTLPWTHRAMRLHDKVSSLYRERNLFHAFAQKQYYRIAYSHNPPAYTLLEQFMGDMEKLLPMEDLFLADDFWVDNLFLEDRDTASVARHHMFNKHDGYDMSLFVSWFTNLLQGWREQRLKAQYGDLFPRGIPNNWENNFFLLEQATDWIKDQLAGIPQPFLAYFHLLPPHDPYLTRREFVDIFKEDGYKPVRKPEHLWTRGYTELGELNGRWMYDEFIAYVDAEFGRLYDFMEKNGLLENTWVVFTSDHGELFERGIVGHGGRTLYDPLVRVPLLISQPGQQSRVDVYDRTSCVDVLPTLLHVTGQEVPDWTEGQVLPPFNPSGFDGGRPLYVFEGASNPRSSPIVRATASLIQDDYKLTYYFGYPKQGRLVELYQIKNDPEELNNLVEVEGDAAKSLLESLQTKIDAINEKYR